MWNNYGDLHWNGGSYLCSCCTKEINDNKWHLHGIDIQDRLIAKFCGITCATTWQDAQAVEEYLTDRKAWKIRLVLVRDVKADVQRQR